MQDLEIYIRDLETEKLTGWLAQHFDRVEVEPAGGGGKALRGACWYRDQRVRVSVYFEAFGKRYSCLILEGDDLPWSSDLVCARSAWRDLATEIRCSPGDWKEGEPVADEKWWRIDERGEQQVVWN